MVPVAECEGAFLVDHDMQMWVLSRCRAVATQHLQVNHQMTDKIHYRRKIQVRGCRGMLDEGSGDGKRDGLRDAGDSAREVAALLSESGLQVSQPVGNGRGVLV